MVARGLGEGDDIVADRFIHVDCQTCSLRSGSEHAVGHRARSSMGWLTAQIEQHAAFLLGRQIAEVDLEEKTIQLGFGQRKGAFVLDGILSGQHHERAQQRARLAVHRDLALAHGFQQRGLGTGRGPVDLIGQQNVGKGRAGHELKGACLLIEDADAGDVAGQQVGRTLEAAEVDAQRDGQGTGQHGLAHAGHIFQQHMAFA